MVGSETQVGHTPQQKGAGTGEAWPGWGGSNSNLPSQHLEASTTGRYRYTPPRTAQPSAQRRRPPTRARVAKALAGGDDASVVPGIHQYRGSLAVQPQVLRGAAAGKAGVRQGQAGASAGLLAAGAHVPARRTPRPSAARVKPCPSRQPGALSSSPSPSPHHIHCTPPPPPSPSPHHIHCTPPPPPRPTPRKGTAGRGGRHACGRQPAHS